MRPKTRAPRSRRALTAALVSLFPLAAAAAPAIVPDEGLSRGAWPDRVDIDVLPAPADAAPHIAIVHDHATPEGPLGSNHTLLVGSVIARRSASSGVPLLGAAADGAESTYQLDGQPLVQVETTFSLPYLHIVLPWSEHFEPQTYSGARLDYHGDTNTWTMENDGWTWVYGSTDGTGANATKKESVIVSLPLGSFVEMPLPNCADGTQLCHTVAWYLSLATDPYGNTITYDYQVPAVPADLSGTFGQITTRQHLPDHITYAGGQATVTFGYEERPDPRMDNSSGLPTLLTQRLTGIASLGRNGAEFSSYGVEYKDTGLDCDGNPLPAADVEDLSTRPLQTLVRRIVRDAADGSGTSRVLRCEDTWHTTPTWPAYADSTDISTSVPVPTGWTTGGSDVFRTVSPIAVNLDGDGAPDLVMLAWRCTDDTHCTAYHRVYLARPRGANPFIGEADASGDDLAIIQAWQNELATWLDGDFVAYHRGWSLGDLDGDLRPDLLVEGPSTTGTASDPGPISVVRYRGGSTFTTTAVSDLTACDLRFSELVDVDGDRRPDLIRRAHPANDDCALEAQTKWVANSGEQPFFAWARAERLHLPLEASTPPAEWTATISQSSASDVCYGHTLLPKSDPRDVASDDDALASYARFGDFNADGLADVAFALYGCFDWQTDPCSYWTPVTASLYSRIFYGQGDGTFVDSGLHAGGPAAEYQMTYAIPDGGGGFCEPDPRSDLLLATDLDRDGHPELVRSEAMVSGTTAAHDRGLLSGYGLSNADPVPVDIALPETYAHSLDTKVEATTLADFDGNGFPDQLQVYFGNAASSEDYWKIRLSSAQETVAEGRVTHSDNSWGGRTALSWGFTAAGDDNPDLPYNVEVLAGLDGGAGQVDYRYTGGDVSRQDFAGFGYVERANERDGVEGFGFHTEDARRGLPSHAERFRADGTLEHETVYIHGERYDGGGYGYDLLPPYFSPLIRQCDYEVGYGFVTMSGVAQTVSVDGLVQSCEDFADPFNQDLPLAPWKYPFDPDAQPPEWWTGYGDQEQVAWPEGVTFEPVQSPPPTTERGIFRTYVRGVPGLLHVQMSPAQGPVDLQAFFHGPGALLPVTPLWEPNPTAWRWKRPDGVAVPGDVSVPTTHAPPGDTRVRSYITDWDFDSTSRRLDARYDHRDTSTTDDDLRTTLTQQQPSSRGHWYRLTDLTMTDRTGQQWRAVHRTDFDPDAFDHAGTVETCGRTATACRTERFTWNGDGTLATHTQPDASVESWTYAWCGEAATYTDEVGRTRTHTWDDRCLETADAWLGATSTFAYDGFNRRTQTTIDPGGGNPPATVSLYQDDALAIRQDDDFEEPRLARLRSDGQLELTFLDDFGRRTLRETCENAGPLPDHADDVLGQVSCAPGTEVVTEWRGYSRDGRLKAQLSRPYAPASEVAAVTGYTDDEYGRVRVAQSPAPVAAVSGGEAWVSTSFDFGPGWQTQVDPLGRVTVEDRSTLEQTVTVAGALQRRTSYNAFGLATETEGAGGLVADLLYDDLDQLAAKHYVAAADCIPAGGSILASCTYELTYQYDARGRLTASLAADGTGPITTYDAVGRPTATAFYDGSTSAPLRSWVYDDAIPSVAITDEAGNVMTRTTDGLGRVLSEDFLGLTSTWTYGVNGKPATMTDPDGLTATWTYDVLDRPATITRPASGTTAYTYDGGGHLVEQTDADGATSSWRFLFSGDLDSEWLGAWELSSYGYDDASRPTSAYVDGVTSRYTFDDFDRLTHLDRGIDSGTGAVSIRADMTYDSGHHLLTRSVAPVQGTTATTTWTYNAWGWVTTEQDALGNTSRVEYDVTGRPRFREDAEAYRAETRYDSRGRVVWRDVPGHGGLTLTYTVGAALDGVAGYNEVQTEDGEGSVRTRWFDGLGRLAGEDLPDGTARRYTWDGDHLATTSWLDASGTTLRELRRSYDPTRGLLTTIEGPAEPSEFGGSGAVYAIDYGYTDAGRLSSVTTPGETTTFAYDADGMRTTESWAGLTRTLYREDAWPWVSRETLVGSGATRETTYARDPAGRLAERTATDGSHTELQRWMNLNAYGAPARTESYVDGAVSVQETWSYQLTGEPTRRDVLLPSGPATTFWSYYRNGVRASVRAPSNVFVAYDYGMTFDYQLDRIHDGMGTDYAVFTARNGRGQPTDVSTPQARMTFDYDSLGRLKRRDTWAPSSGLLETTWQATFDDLGQMDSETYTAPDASWANTYAYDSAGRLIGEFHGLDGRTLAYDLDDSGNRLTTTVTDGSGATTVPMTATYSGDTLQTVNGTSLGYDDWLGVTQDQRGYTYERTASGELRALNAAGARHLISRDADGLPVLRSRNGGPARATFWDLDAKKLPLEVRQPDGSALTYLSADGLLVGRVRTPTVGPRTIIAELADPGGTLDRFAGDSLGEATAFGEGAIGPPPGDERFLFHRMESIADAPEVQIARYREYDSTTGRFLSPDPSGLDGGPHRTIYADGDPVQKQDPLGLMAVIVDGTMMDLSEGMVSAMLNSGAAISADQAYAEAAGRAQAALALVAQSLRNRPSCPMDAICHPSGFTGTLAADDTGVDAGGSDDPSGGSGDGGDDGGDDGPGLGSGNPDPDQRVTFTDWDPKTLTIGYTTDGGEKVTGTVVHGGYTDEGALELTVRTSDGSTRTVVGDQGTSQTPGDGGGPTDSTTTSTGPTTIEDPGTATVDSGGLDATRGGGSSIGDYVSVRVDIVGQVIGERIDGFMGGLSNLAGMAEHPIDTWMNYTPAGRLIQGDYSGAASLMAQQMTMPFRMAGGMVAIGVRGVVAPVEMPYRAWQFWGSGDPATIKEGVNGVIDSAAAQAATATMAMGGAGLAGVGAGGAAALGEGAAALGDGAATLGEGAAALGEGTEAVGEGTAALGGDASAAGEGAGEGASGIGEGAGDGSSASQAKPRDGYFVRNGKPTKLIRKTVVRDTKPIPKAGSSGGPGAGLEFDQDAAAAERSAANGRCRYCGAKTTEEPGPLQGQTDHADPRARGGNNTFGNANHACRTCNLQKGAKTVSEFSMWKFGYEWTPGTPFGTPPPAE